MTYNLLRAPVSGASIGTPEITEVQAHLNRDGWAILRGYSADMDSFSSLTASLCRSITFDPAREYSKENTQKVDAGLGPIGLHIENGNTPVCPDIVAFFSPRAAFEGSQTTICDGRDVWQAMSDAQKARWAQPMTVSRRLPELLWKRYLANEHPALTSPEEVTQEHVLQFKAAIPNQDFDVHEDGSLTYHITLMPVRESAVSGGQGFANAVLGPSHNYQPPVYRFADGTRVSQEEIEELRRLAEAFTTEINWQDGDIAVLDNTRIMHGRRAIKDPDRELFIGMGRL